MKKLFIFCILFYAAAIFSAAIIRDASTVDYNGVTHCPNWVAYILTASDIEANYSRCSFKKDPLIKESVPDSWYLFSGYERGHLCPGEDKGKDTYYTSNICPQNPVLNKGLWKEIEIQIRKEAKVKGRLIVICGPVFSGTAEKWIKYTIRIPDAFFKIVYSESETRAYLIPNLPVSGANPEDYKSNISSIENLTGLNFENIKRGLENENANR